MVVLFSQHLIIFIKIAYDYVSIKKIYLQAELHFVMFRREIAEVLTIPTRFKNNLVRIWECRYPQMKKEKNLCWCTQTSTLNVRMTIQHLVFSKSDSDSNWTEIVASTKSVSMTNEEKYMLVVTVVHLWKKFIDKASHCQRKCSRYSSILISRRNMYA